MEIDNLVQHTWLTTAGTFTLPDLSLGFGGGCPSPSAGAASVASVAAEPPLLGRPAAAPGRP